MNIVNEHRIMQFLKFPMVIKINVIQLNLPVEEFTVFFLDCNVAYIAYITSELL